MLFLAEGAVVLTHPLGIGAVICAGQCLEVLTKMTGPVVLYLWGIFGPSQNHFGNNFRPWMAARSGQIHDCAQFLGPWLCWRVEYHTRRGTKAIVYQGPTEFVV